MAVGEDEGGDGGGNDGEDDGVGLLVHVDFPVLAASNLAR